jgi:hypothetical protein
MKIVGKHPFAVDAFFERSVVLTFAAPKESLQHLIPDCLSLDTLEDKWGFIAVALVQTRQLRPKGLPAFFGNDFFLIGYRIFVRYESENGKRLRGLYILKSETDNRRMEFFGNLFTDYNYSTTDIEVDTKTDSFRYNSIKSNLHVECQLAVEEAPLPLDSPFECWKMARRFAGPLPFTFSVDTKERSVMIIEGVRENWKPNPLIVHKSTCGYLDGLHLDKLVLASAFQVEQIPYSWKKGRREQY